MITRKDVEHVALLARLELTEEEKELYTGQLAKILEYASVLRELDTENVPPLAHVLPLQNVFREDKVGTHLDAEAVLAHAPDREERFFRVPRIV
ncbi:Asp-tRNA(Asn)/Glu-tRNA(Gln) amidotransferase subunit GatC [Thermodesulfitimonas autotrophica]|jgi:aspartyl-tRNA(Asn)/glutamyl-tRNA(Gln) amidotransferase subunit C|uniref:Asp-tRNA(Asn)/Glu-tRNA(Gln) amidotransferase subunit GatC n=1 Tax=Thermodesulfitimonas autotrophica TaxID=1894989 RepID=UPI002FE27C53